MGKDNKQAKEQGQNRNEDLMHHREQDRESARGAYSGIWGKTM